MPKLTKRLIDNLAAQQSDFIIWDSELSGFAIRVKPTGVKSFCVQYRNKRGRSRRFTLGRYGRLTLEEARSMARQVLAESDKGQDPAEERQILRQTPSIRELAERFLTEHAEVRKKASSVAKDRQWLNRFIIPALGIRKVDDVTRRDIYALHYSMRSTPYQANRTLEVLRKMFNLAEAWGLLPDGSNPCRHVSKYQEHQRQRYLSPDEMASLGAALAEIEQDGSESISAISVVRLLLFTGCRLGEILNLRWVDVDMKTGCLRLPDSKTGARVVILGEPALETLASIPLLDGNPYVAPGYKPGAPLVGIHRAWYRILARAGLEGVRLHDLRHSFASVAAADGLGLPIIGALLGHTQPNTTQRYAHLHQDPLRAAANLVSNKIGQFMSGKTYQTIINAPKGI